MVIAFHCITLLQNKPYYLFTQTVKLIDSVINKFILYVPCQIFILTLSNAREKNIHVALL